MSSKLLKHETRVLVLTLVSGAPAVAVALWLLAVSTLAPVTSWVLAVLIVAVWWSLAWAVRERVIRPLQTASNLLSALREEDFSVRARSPARDDALGELMHEINALSQTLREQRLGALEASALLRTVMTEIDVAVFAFDDQGRLKLVNRAGERLLARPAAQLLDRTAAELSLINFLTGEPARTVQGPFPGSNGRWALRRGSFRQEGRPHQLLVMTDLSRALRDEERLAWQRLVRVIGHEINNSLAPIKSIAGTMSAILARTPRPDDWESDLQGGLAVIASRADALGRFMEGYARLARLPAPRRQNVDVQALVLRVAALEKRVSIAIEPGPPVVIQADGDQLEQLLINVVRNAADAAREGQRRGEVAIGWNRRAGPEGETLEVWVRDDGPGLAESANLFVPFYTTKPHGTGIGLALGRQIAEGHAGNLTLENRPDGSGCIGRLILPLA